MKKIWHLDRNADLRELISMHRQQLSLIPVNKDSVTSARKLLVQLHMMPVGYPLLVMASRESCEFSGTDCIYATRCAAVTSADAFASVVCAKIYTLSKLFYLGSDVFIVDSDVTVLRTLHQVWRGPLRDASIVAQYDIPFINSGVLRAQHVSPAADAIVSWLFSEWLHRVMAVWNATGRCDGCDQAILNEIVANSAAGRHSVLMLIDAVLRATAAHTNTRRTVSELKSHTKALWREARLYLEEPNLHAVAYAQYVMRLLPPAHAAHANDTYSTMKLRGLPALQHALHNERWIPQPSLDSTGPARLFVATKRLHAHWGDVVRRALRRERRIGLCEPFHSIHLSGYGVRPLRSLVLQLLLPFSHAHLSAFPSNPELLQLQLPPSLPHGLPPPSPPPPPPPPPLVPHHVPLTTRVLFATVEGEAARSQTAFEVAMLRASRIVLLTGWKLAVPLLPQGVIWRTGERTAGAQSYTTFTSGCPPKALYYWTPSTLVTICSGAFLNAFRDSDGWIIEGDTGRIPAVVSVAEQLVLQGAGWERRLAQALVESPSRARAMRITIRVHHAKPMSFDNLQRRSRTCRLLRTKLNTSW
mmetsp:Transcript_59770/g.99156  ORF Transcript_59770/g.99156 Transcript_59770/m.99156 type:complete len:586 (-) Transcript_59770:98-1855(-)